MSNFYMNTDVCKSCPNNPAKSRFGIVNCCCSAPYMSPTLYEDYSDYEDYEPVDVFVERNVYGGY